MGHQGGAAREEGAHLRMPVNMATLFIGWDLGLQYALHVGAIDGARHGALRELGWSTLLGLGEAQRAVAEEERPVEMYMNAISELLAQGSIYLKHRHHQEDAHREHPIAANRMANAEPIGYYGNDDSDAASYVDSQYWYLSPGVTYRVVATFYHSSGGTFPDTPHGIKAKLREQRLLFPASGRSFDYQLSPDLPRVLRILRPKATGNP